MCHEKRGRQQRLLRGSSVLLASALLAGCGLLDSKKADYRSVQRSRPLDVPPELSAPAKDDRYTVSEAGNKGTTYSSYNAERSAAKPASNLPEVKPAPVLVWQADKFRIQRAGNQRWLVMTGTPADIWPQVRRFVDERGLVVKAESPELGIIETEWAERAAYVPQDGIRGQLARALGTLYSTGERDKYRIRLEPGLEPGTTDVFVSHRGVEEVFVTEGKDVTRWQPRASDPDLELELLGRLIQFVGIDQKAAASIIATDSKNLPGERARLVDVGGKLSLDVDERFDRAWRRVGLALDRNGFTVEDRDRAKGYYFVRFDDPLVGKQAADKSWLESIAFWRDDKSSVDPSQSKFRISVVGAGDELSRVEIQDQFGRILSTPVARKILDVVRNDLK